MKIYTVIFKYARRMDYSLMGNYSTLDKAKEAVKEFADNFGETLIEDGKYEGIEEWFYPVDKGGSYRISETILDQEDTYEDDEDGDDVIAEADAERIVEVAKFATMWILMTKLGITNPPKALADALSLEICAHYADFKGIERVKLANENEDEED